MTPLPRWVKTFVSRIACILHCIGIPTFDELDPSSSGGNDFSLSKENVVTSLMTSSECSEESVGLQELSEENSESDSLQHCKLDTVLDEMKVIVRTLHEMDEQDVYEMEWKHLARILDRFFFVLTLFAFLLSSLGVLLPAYFMHQKEDAALGLH